MRRHLERSTSGTGAPSGELEPAGLDDARERDDREQPAQHDQQQLGTGQDREPRHQPAERHRARVAHEDLRRRRVPPEESEARAHRRCGDDGEVARVAYLVAAVQTGAPGPHRWRAWMNADQRVRAEHHRRGAGGQPVQAVGEVHRVRRRRHDDVSEDDEAGRADSERRDVADVGQVSRRGREPEHGCGTSTPARRKSPRRSTGRANFARARSPRLRWRRSLMKSSRKPTTPSPTMRNSSSRPDAVGPRPPWKAVTIWAAK